MQSETEFLSILSKCIKLFYKTTPNFIEGAVYSADDLIKQRVLLLMSKVEGEFPEVEGTTLDERILELDAEITYLKGFVNGLKNTIDQDLKIQIEILKHEVFKNE